MGKTIIGRRCHGRLHRGRRRRGRPAVRLVRHGDVEWTFTERQGATVPRHRRRPGLHAGAVLYPQIGRGGDRGRLRLFDLTDGGTGRRPRATTSSSSPHAPPTDWEYAGTAPFTFVTDGVRGRERAATRSRGTAGSSTSPPADRRAGAASRPDRPGRDERGARLVRRGRPFFGAMGPGDSVTLANPSRVVQGDRVTHCSTTLRARPQDQA